MNSMIIGQYIPGDSAIHKMNATVKMLCLFAVLTAIVLADSALDYAVIIAFVILIIRLSGISMKTASASIGKLWLFFVVIFFMNAFFFETEQVIWSFWILNLSAKGMTQGANVILRVILLMFITNILTSTTTPIEITEAIKNIISPLRIFHVPTADIAMIISVAIQFIPTFIEETDMIKKAQTARGAKFESKNFKDKAVSMLPLVVPIFISAFRRADELSTAMEARGYRKANQNTKIWR